MIRIFLDSNWNPADEATAVVVKVFREDSLSPQMLLANSQKSRNANGPQTIRGESRAAPGSVAEGDFVSWDSSGGRARGRIVHVMDYGRLDVPGTDFAIDATEEDPAALITVYEEVAGGWRPTETQVGHKVSTLTKIDPLPEPPPVEESAYGKPKRKGRKRGE